MKKGDDDTVIYLDYAASTPIDPEVIETVTRVMSDYPGNPSAIHRLGLEAADLLAQARRQMAHILNVQPAELIFTSGATESNHLAIRGAAEAYRARGNHLITTAVEHPSVLGAFRRLAERDGFRVTVLPVNGQGVIELADLERAITPQTILVSVAHAVNEVGSLQPIAAIGRLLRGYRHILFHVDASQTLGKCPPEWMANGIDLLSGSAQKWHGPKGVGFLFCRSGVHLQAQLPGGGQQAGLRAGTENLALIAGMAKAMRLHFRPDVARRLYDLRALWIAELAAIEQVQLSGSHLNEQMAPHIVHFCLPDYKAEVIVRALSAAGIYVSSQSACSSRSGAPSQVLLAMGRSEDEARSGIRISYGASLQEIEIKQTIACLREILARSATSMKENRSWHARSSSASRT